MSGGFIDIVGETTGSRADGPVKFGNVNFGGGLGLANNPTISYAVIAAVAIIAIMLLKKAK